MRPERVKKQATRPSVKSSFDVGNDAKCICPPHKPTNGFGGQIDFVSSGNIVPDERNGRVHDPSMGPLFELSPRIGRLALGRDHGVERP